MKKIFTSIIFSVFLFSVTAFAWTTPNHDSPSNGSSVYTGVYVDWYAVASSHGYQLQVDTSATFDSPVLYEKFETYINTSSSNSDTEEYLDDLFFGTTYYWRVRAYQTGDTSVWSTAWTFITRDYVTHNTPSNGSSAQYTGIYLDWYAHTGVDYYDIEVDTTLNFNSPMKRSATD
ncbi:MAG: hypothetical protein C0592_04340, partial [Marinilabiliales bacterium]